MSLACCGGSVLIVHAPPFVEDQTSNPPLGYLVQPVIHTVPLFGPAASPAAIDVAQPPPPAAGWELHARASEANAAMANEAIIEEATENLRSKNIIITYSAFVC